MQRLDETKLNIGLLGGWYGQLAYMLFIRNQLQINKITSYDIDPSVQSVANMINSTWAMEGRFEARTEDCMKLGTYDGLDIVINTSAEHFASVDWFYNIPKGTIVIIQSNDMKHPTHVANVGSVKEMCEKYCFHEHFYLGTKSFQYKTWGFNRFMIIGER